jgi:hypothetical protein
MTRNRQIILLVVLVVVAGFVWSFETNKRTPAMQMANSIQNVKVGAIENPQIRWAELERAQKTEYKSNGRNPFSPIAPPKPGDTPKPKPKKIGPEPPPPEPPKPTESHLPANLKYFGYGTVPTGSPRRAFITDGEDVYIVTEGDTLLGRYRILKIGNADLEFQEISSGLPGKAPLEEQAAPPSV